MCIIFPAEKTRSNSPVRFLKFLRFSRWVLAKNDVIGYHLVKVSIKTENGADLGIYGPKNSLV